MGGMTNRPLPLVERLIVEHWPRLAGIVREARAQWPAVLDEQWPAIVSYLGGDEEPLRVFVEKHVGTPTPSFVFPALEGRDIGDLDEWETWEFIEHHKARAEAKKAGDSRKRVRQQIRKYGSVREALSVLANYYNKSLERVLLDKIEEVCVEEASELSDRELASAAANLIRREATEKRKSCVPAKQLLLSDDWVPDNLARRDLDAFEALDCLQRLANTADRSRQTRPSPLELETFARSGYMTNREIAAERKRSENQIKQEKLRAVRKYRRAAEL